MRKGNPGGLTAMKQLTTRFLITSGVAICLGSIPIYATDEAREDEHHEQSAHAAAHDSGHDDSHGGESHHGPLRFEVGFANRRLWRGFVENDTPALQPKIAFHYKGFGVSSWSNIAHTSPHSQNWTEHEVEVEYERHFGKFKGIVGYIHYTFPDIAPTKISADDHAPVVHHVSLPARGVFASAAAAGGDSGHAVYPRYTQEAFVGVEHESCGG